MKPLIPYFEVVSFHLFDTPAIPALGLESIPITVHGFGLLVGLGFFIGAEVARRKANRHGLEGELILQLVNWLIVGTLVGGHLGHALFYEPEVYFADPIRFLYVWDGLSSIGGLLTCSAISVWFFRSRKQPYFPYADCLAYGLGIGWFFGRMGCFTAHDHPGVVTEFYLGVYGMCPDRPLSTACHDLGLYEALFGLTVFGVFTWLQRKPLPSGTLIGLLAACYGLARFGLDFLRHPDIDARYLGLTPAQYGALFFMCLGIFVVMSRRGAPLLRDVGDSEL